MASIGPGADGREWTAYTVDFTDGLGLQLGPALMAGNGRAAHPPVYLIAKLQLGPALMAGNGSFVEKDGLGEVELQLGPALMAGNGRAQGWRFSRSTCFNWARR